MKIQRPRPFPPTGSWKGPLLSLFLLIPFPAAAADRGEEARLLAVKRFYARITPRKTGGAPEPAELKALSPQISRRLRASLLAAYREQETAAKLNPMITPYPGALFFSLFEGAQRVAGIRRDPQAKGPAYLVTLEYSDAPSGGKVSRWDDRARLVREGGRWVVNDLDFLGDWDFAPHGSLSEVLPRPRSKPVEKGLKGP